MKKTIIFDIDGTLANLDHRLHYVNGPRKDWKAFLAGVKDDLPIEQTIFINNLFSQITTFDIVLSSGRSDNEREDTVYWLAKYGVRYSKLYMRKAGDFRADYIVKKEMLEEMRADGREPWLVIDDRQSVVDMWRAQGLFVLQCAPKETATDMYHFGKHISFPLTLMVGPSGAGKSTWLETSRLHQRISNDSIISSDQLRAQICGDFKDQSQNVRVFEAMHSMIEHRLKLGLPVVVDATNIRDADRTKIVKLAPEAMPVRYIVINRPLEEKLATAGWRKDVLVKGIPLIKKHDEVFNSNKKAIMKGDGFPNVTVVDLTK